MLKVKNMHILITKLKHIIFVPLFIHRKQIFRSEVAVHLNLVKAQSLAIVNVSKRNVTAPPAKYIIHIALLLYTAVLAFGVDRLFGA